MADLERLNEIWQAGSASAWTGEAIDAYLHTYYEDIQDLDLENVYKIGL